MFKKAFRTLNSNSLNAALRSFRPVHLDPQALNVTNKAAQKLKQIAENGECLRITVEGGGCAGFEYKLKLDKERLADDVVIERDGASVVVDEISLDFLRGSTIDYTEDLMRSAFRITDNPLSTQGCSCGSSFAPKEFGQESSGEESGKQQEDQKKTGSKDDGRSNGPAGTIFAVSLATMIKDFFTYRPNLDEDPIKNKVKQAMLYRNRRHFDKALEILEDLLKEVIELGEDWPITRVHYELAYTYYLRDELDKADEKFRLVIARLIQLHKKADNSPEFIGISLKLADIFARRGDLENAEIGYRHCVNKQMIMMEEHMKNYFVSKGAVQEEFHKVETFGPKYSDPLALFGMCLEQFAHFLINYFDEGREAEACEYMNEVLKLSYHIYGPSSFHAINLLNNFGAACILRNRFESGRKYLGIGIDRIIHINECSDIIVGYYCNYAEALFHCGQIDEALAYAEKAVRFSKSAPEGVRKYAEKYFKDIRRDQWKARQALSNAQ